MWAAHHVAYLASLVCAAGAGHRAAAAAMTTAASAAGSPATTAGSPHPTAPGAPPTGSTGTWYGWRQRRGAVVAPLVRPQPSPRATSSSATAAAEVAALRAFERANRVGRAPNTCLDTWRVDSDPCFPEGSWRGVVCEEDRVVYLGFLVNDDDQLVSGAFRGCALGTVPPEVGELTELAFVDLSGNELQRLPANVSRWVQLESLDVSHNALVELPLGIASRKPFLETLEVSYNALRSMVSVAALSSLQILRVSNNRGLGKLPAGLGQLKELIELDARALNATTVPSEIGGCQKLRRIYLDDNRLETLPESLGSLPLDILHANHNRLRELPGNGSLRWQLSELQVGGNQLEALPRGYTGEMTHMRTLDVANNRLQELPSEFCSEGGGCPSMRFLRLGSNNLSALPPLRLRLPKLEDLHLEHNRYESLPKNLGDLLPSLRDLYLANNSLHQLPPSLGGVATLRELHVEDNSLAELPAWCTRANLTHVDATNNLIVALPQLHDAFDTLEYLHLRGNPVNASTEALALELQRVPKLLSFDVTISTNQVYVGSQVPGFAACAKYDSYGIGKCWPHVDPPSQCNVGLPCTFRVQFYDANGVKIRSGGKLSGLSVRRAGADGRTRTTQLLDLRDGRFEGTIPDGLDWINHTASREFPFKDRGSAADVDDAADGHIFRLFLGDHEFFAPLDMAGVHRCNTFPNCPLKLPYGPRTDCSAAGHAVPDAASGASCQCKTSSCGVPFERQEGEGPTLRCAVSCTAKQGRRRSRDGTTCECAENSYDTEMNGAVICAAGQWQELHTFKEYQDVQSDREKSPPLHCSKCPACATCTNGVVKLHKGWRLNASSSAAMAALIERGKAGAPQVAFRCPFEDDCPEVALSVPQGCEINTPAMPNNTDCQRNHDGPLCAACRPNYSKQGFAQSECAECWVSADAYARKTFGMSSAAFIATAVGLLCSVLLLCYFQRNRLSHAKAELSINLRILFGAAQVLSLVSATLDLVYPEGTQAAMSFSAVFVANAFSLFRAECWGWSYQQIWMRIVWVGPALVLSVIVCCVLWYQWRGRHDEQGAAAERTALHQLVWNIVFFAIVLLYPQVSSKILSALQCRSLGESYAVLQADYAVKCSTHAFGFWQISDGLALQVTVLTLLVPIGIPLTLCVVFRRQWRKNKALWAATDNAGDEQQRINLIADLHAARPDTCPPPELVSFQSLPEFHYCMVRQKYAVFVMDYKVESWWYEPVDMIRKLGLTGLLLFVRRGTVEQVLTGCCLAFTSFGMQLLLKPYREPEANVLKAIIDVQIFLVFLISFVLRVAPDIRIEDQSRQNFASLLVGSIVVMLISATILTIRLVRRRHNFRARLAMDGSAGFEFPARENERDTLHVTEEEETKRITMSHALHGGLATTMAQLRDDGDTGLRGRLQLPPEAEMETEMLNTFTIGSINERM